MVIFNSYMLIYQRVQVSNGNSPILVHPVGILLNSMFFGFFFNTEESLRFHQLWPYGYWSKPWHLVNPKS